MIREIAERESGLVWQEILLIVLECWAWSDSKTLKFKYSASNEDLATPYIVEGSRPEVKVSNSLRITSGGGGTVENYFQERKNERIWKNRKMRYHRYNETKTFKQRKHDQ